MAGSLTVSYRDLKSGSKARKVTVDWTSDASAGTVSGATTIDDIHGFIIAIVTNPSGSAAPTALYDVVINDTDGFDVAEALLGNLSATVTARFTPSEAIGSLSDVHRYVDSVLDVVIENAGNSKEGAIDIYWIEV